MKALARVSNGSGLPMLSDWIEDWFARDLGPQFLGRDANFTMPAVNIHETADNFLIELAAPGKKKSDFHVEVDNNLISIRSETEMQKEDDSKGYSRKEFNYTSFTRTFTLPEGVDRDGITAEYKDGILHLTLPKMEEAKEKPPKAIEIK